jgi:hypothetical protein
MLADDWNRLRRNDFRQTEIRNMIRNGISEKVAMVISMSQPS